MINSNRIIKTIALLFAVVGSATLQAQDLNKTTAKKILESKSFVFKAQSAMPTGGPSKQLTSDYDMKVMGDSLVTYLPYFGRAYTAPLPGEGGVNFTSTEFDYQVKEKKRGWDINIKPKDTKDVRQLMLSVTESGYATLQVTSNNKQPISYYGYIAEK